jgi:hypothetical protein
MTMIYRFPGKAFKKAATARIIDPLSGVYGAGTLAGSLASPPSKKLAAIYDTRATGNELPRFVWTSKSGDPDGNGSTTFHGAGIDFTIQGNVYSGRPNSADEADELIDALVALFHHQPLTMDAGFVARIVNCTGIQVIEDPVGQHGIIQFNAQIQARP